MKKKEANVDPNDEEFERVVPCPVCGSIQFPFTGSFEICEVCGWQDDPVQLKNPDETLCANKMSLNQARRAYARKKKLK